MAYEQQTWTHAKEKKKNAERQWIIMLCFMLTQAVGSIQNELIWPTRLVMAHRSASASFVSADLPLDHQRQEKSPLKTPKRGGAAT